jgi:hypothetical protein
MMTSTASTTPIATNSIRRNTPKLLDKLRYLFPGRNAIPAYVESHGERWDLLINLKKNMAPFFMEGKEYYSPTAICRAHADRRTRAHPWRTEPGQIYDYIILTESNKSLAQVYKE